MMSSGTAQLFLSPWVIIFPGVAVAITVIAVNLFRGRVDPRAGYSRPDPGGLSMLNVRDLGVAFGAVQPLSGVSFSVGKGETLGHRW
jgi:hypothetical protein